MSSKPLTPQTIQDTPLPDQQGLLPSPYSSGSGQIYTPQTIPETPLPTSPYTPHVIGDTLDTQSRRILADFYFGLSGALRIGNYQNGVSGDIRISPTGIVGRNKSGAITFSIDGTTGDATYAGILSANQIIGGSLVLGGNSNVNGLLKLYNSSNTQIAQMDNGGLNIAGSGRGLTLLNIIGGTAYGGLTIDTGSGQFQVGSLNSKDLVLYGDRNLVLLVGSGALTIEGRSFAIGNDTTIQQSGASVLITSGGGTKTAIVKTAEGYNALYCAEAPEVWFFDFANDIKSIDPMFLEVTEGEMNTLKTEEGKLLVFRRRKGHGYKRFTPKTAAQFVKNELFLGMAK